MSLSAVIWAVKLLDVRCFENPLPFDKVIVLVIHHALASLAALHVAEAVNVFLSVFGVQVLELASYVLFILTHLVVDH
jgi:hypothetical protein